LNFVAEQLGAEITRTMTQSSSKFFILHSGDFSRPLQIYWFWDFCCWFVVRVLITYSSPMFVRIFKVLGKAAQKIFLHEKQSCERRSKCISWIALLMQYKIEIKVESKTLALFYIFSYGEGLWIRRWKGASPPSPCIWNLAINHQPKLIHSFIPSIKIYCNS